MFQEPTVEKQSKEAEIDKNPLKIIILGIVGIAASFAASFFFTELLSAINLQNFILWMIFSIAFFVCVILQTFFIKSIWKLFTITALEAFAPLVFFFPQIFPSPNLVLLVGAVLFFLFLSEGVREGHAFIRDSLSIRFSFVSRGILTKAITGFLIFLSAVTYVWYFDLGRFNPSDGYKLMSKSVFSVEPFVQVWFPGASLEQSTDSFLRKIAESELRKLPSTPQGIQDENRKSVDFSILTKQQQERAIAETSESLRTSFEKTLGIEIQKTALVKDVMFSFVKSKIDQFSEKTKSYFGIIVILVFFSSFKGFFAIFGWLIRFIAFLFYKILIVLGFAYINIETRNREFILLK